jgi:hypothetical protein
MQQMADPFRRTFGCAAACSAASAGLAAAAEQSNDQLNEKPKIVRRSDATREFCIGS